LIRSTGRPNWLRRKRAQAALLAMGAKEPLRAIPSADGPETPVRGPCNSYVGAVAAGALPGQARILRQASGPWGRMRKTVRYVAFPADTVGPRKPMDDARSQQAQGV
jgi:hypothetical protein